VKTLAWFAGVPAITTALALLCIALAGCAAAPVREVVQSLKDCPVPTPVVCPPDADVVLDLGLVNLPSAAEFNALTDEQKLRKLLDASVVHRIGQMQMHDQLVKAVECVKALRAAGR
jgi:hypothetical protein